MENYESLGVIGEGTYGVVIRARHRETGQHVAIKKFKESEDDEPTKKTSLREVRLLKQLRHDNIISLLEVFRRKGKLYLVFEYVDRTILEVIEKEHPNGLPEQDAKKYMYQLLRGLDFCHQHNVIHRDVKPENILISHKGTLKICDFGFARVANPGGKFTDYVATRWYRSPELLVGDVGYNRAVDIWALGCILAEITTGMPLFPGESDLDEISHITRCFGRLIPRHVQTFRKNELFRGVPLPDPGDANSAKLETLEKRFPRADPAWMQLLKCCLRLDPEQRCSCATLMELPYFTDNNWRDRYEAHLAQLFDAEHRKLMSFKRSGSGASNSNTKKSSSSKGDGRKGSTTDGGSSTDGGGALGSRKSSTVNNSSSKRTPSPVTQIINKDGSSVSGPSTQPETSLQPPSKSSKSKSLQQQQAHQQQLLLQQQQQLQQQQNHSSYNQQQHQANDDEYGNSNNTSVTMTNNNNNSSTGLPGIRGAAPRSEDYNNSGNTGGNGSFLPSIGGSGGLAGVGRNSPSTLSHSHQQHQPTTTMNQKSSYVGSSSYSNTNSGQNSLVGSRDGGPRSDYRLGGGGGNNNNSNNLSNMMSSSLNSNSHNNHGGYGGAGGGTGSTQITPTSTLSYGNNVKPSLLLGGNNTNNNTRNSVVGGSSSLNNNTNTNQHQQHYGIYSSSNNNNRSGGGNHNNNQQLPSLSIAGSSATSIFNTMNNNNNSHHQQHHQNSSSSSNHVPGSLFSGGGFHHGGTNNNTSNNYYSSSNQQQQQQQASPYSIPVGNIGSSGASAMMSGGNHNHSSSSSTGLPLSYKKKNNSHKKSLNSVTTNMGLPSYLPSSSSHENTYGSSGNNNNNNMMPNNLYTSTSSSSGGGGNNNNANFGITGSRLVSNNNSNVPYSHNMMTVPPLSNNNSNNQNTSLGSREGGRR